MYVNFSLLLFTTTLTLRVWRLPLHFTTSLEPFRRPSRSVPSSTTYLVVKVKSRIWVLFPFVCRCVFEYTFTCVMISGIGFFYPSWVYRKLTTYLFTPDRCVTLLWSAIFPYFVTTLRGRTSSGLLYDRFLRLVDPGVNRTKLMMLYRSWKWFVRYDLQVE